MQLIEEQAPPTSFSANQTAPVSANQQPSFTNNQSASFTTPVSHGVLGTGFPAFSSVSAALAQHQFELAAAQMALPISLPVSLHDKPTTGSKNRDEAPAPAPIDIAPVSPSTVSTRLSFFLHSCHLQQTVF